LFTGIAATVVASAAAAAAVIQNIYLYFDFEIGRFIHHFCK
jgi:hypothetical protein